MRPLSLGVPDKAGVERDRGAPTRRYLRADNMFPAVSDSKPHHLAHRGGMHENRVEIVTLLRIKTVARNWAEAPDEVECLSLASDLRRFDINNSSAALVTLNRLRTDLREFAIKERAVEPFDGLVFLEVAANTNDAMALGSNAGTYSQRMNDDARFVGIRGCGAQSIALGVLPPGKLETCFGHLSPHVTTNTIVVTRKAVKDQGDPRQHERGQIGQFRHLHDP
jgi:hypothetical protein